MQDPHIFAHPQKCGKCYKTDILKKYRFMHMCSAQAIRVLQDGYENVK